LLFKFIVILLDKNFFKYIVMYVHDFVCGEFYFNNFLFY